MLCITWSRRISEIQKSKKSFPVEKLTHLSIKEYQDFQTPNFKIPYSEMQILKQILQSLMYDRTMALKQWIIYILAEFHGSNSPSCHKRGPTSSAFLSEWLTPSSGLFPELYLFDKTPNISICFLLYFRCYSETSKDKALANKTPSCPVAPQLPDPHHQSAKVPKFPFSCRITWQQHTHFDGTQITCLLQKGLQSILSPQIKILHRLMTSP